MPRSSTWTVAAGDMIRVDRSQLALIPSVRSAVGIAVPLVVGQATGHFLVGVGAAVGALTAGMASLQGAYRSRVTIMALAAVSFAASAFVGATAGHVLGLDIALTAGWGFAAGLVVVFGPAPSVVGLQAVIGLVVFSQFSLSAHEAALTALWALSGGALQILLVALVWPWQRFPIERRAASAAYQRLSVHVRSLADDPSALLDPTALDELRTAVVETQPWGDPTTAAAFQALADEAERIRLEAAGLARGRARLARAASGDERVIRAAHALDAAVDASATLLAATAQALRDGRRVSVDGESRECFRHAVAELRASADVTDGWDHAVLTQAIGGLTALAGQLRTVAQLAAVAGGERSPTTSDVPLDAHPPLPRRATRPPLTAHPLEVLRANLTLTSEALRHALRVGVTLAIAVAISHLFPFGHGYWLAMTVMIVLKPDFATTVSRGLARSVGTLVGAGLVTLLIAALHPSPSILIVATVVLYGASVAVLRANYVLYSVGVASLVVILLAFTGTPAISLAADRSFYTVLGAALALAAYAAWPTWERARLPDRLAQLVEVDGRYAAALLRAWADPAAADRASLDRVRRAARLARTNAEASFDRWRSEPRGRAGSDAPGGLSVEQAQGVLAAVRRFVWAALALHGQLPGDGPTRPDLLRLSVDVDRALGAVSAALRTGAAPNDFPHLRATQVALAAGLLHGPSRGDGASALTRSDVVVISETDLLVNAVDTLAHLVGVPNEALAEPGDEST
ncbi:MAG: FUSC family protein [Acidimicrobiales bacterium]